MMTLQLPPSSNWSQLESERFRSPQDFASSTVDCLPALFLGLVARTAELLTYVGGSPRKFPAPPRGFEGMNLLPPNVGVQCRDSCSEHSTREAALGCVSHCKTSCITSWPDRCA